MMSNVTELATMMAMIAMVAGFIGQFLLGMAATIGFAILFNTPRRVLLQVAVIGGIGHVVRYGLHNIGVSAEASSFAGAFVVGLAGYYAAKPYHYPRLILTVTAVVPLIPGIPAYETVVYFASGQYLFGIASGVRAALAAGAIAGGLTTARLLTDQRWTAVEWMQKEMQ